MNEDSLDKLCLPLPPTPINIALPLGCLKILQILNICSTASSKKTKSSLSFDEKL
jgi:hypothetical protein